MQKVCCSHQQSGFSLAEALISVVILALIGMLSYGSLVRTLAARERATQIIERYHSVRTAMLRMANEISMAYLSQNRDCSEPRSLTVFNAKRASFGTRLNFTSFSHVKMRADAKECDENELSYYVDNDPNDATQHHLLRREQARVDERPEEGGSTQVMAPNIEDLNFEFYNAKADKWEDEWDATASDTHDQLPKYVAIHLSAKDHLGKVLKFHTKTRLYLREANFIPGLGRGRCLE